MGWAHRWKPPQGEGHGGDASGIPASGIAANGLYDKFRADNQPPPHHLSIGKMEAKEYREAVKAKLATKLDVFDRATSPDAPIMAQLKALEMMENRVYGQAKQIIETQEDTRTEDEIRAEIERKRREAGLE